nr:hypothetical protein [Gemmatimonadota bacterium]NIR39667.1 hypothetical protein [Actinomycetota bacterium]NIU77816.1 hypothetical protein [Gammaproteobacteria bacterium]NIY11297.1 hypothetical protein [Gemmatimonadota bacterium]
MRRGPGGVALLVTLSVACGPPAAWSGLSPDHRTSYEVSRRQGATCVRVGEREDGCFDAVAFHRMTFSADSRGAAYPARVGDRWFVVWNGRSGPAVDGIGEIVLSRDGRRLAYAAERDTAWYVVVDGVFGDPFDSLIANTLSIDPSGEHVAFAASRDGRVEVHVDGTRVATHDGIADLSFRPGRDDVVFVAVDGSDVTISVAGRRGRRHDAIPEYAAGPDGAIAYIARDGSRWWVREPAGDRGPFPGVRSLHLGADSKATFVVHDSAGERVFHGGALGPRFGRIQGPAVSADGRRWGYIGRTEGGFVVMLDGHVHSEHARAGDLTFSPDGERHAFLARRGDTTFVVHDRGREAFDVVVDGTLQFTDRGCWTALVGEWPERTLSVVVEDHRRKRPFDWWDFSGELAGMPVGPGATDAAEDALGSWVAAEAGLIEGHGCAGPGRRTAPRSPGIPSASTHS